jgi:cytochrome c biogenesis protein CcdA
VFAISLALAVGLGKTTTACGLNVLGYLAGPTEPRPLRLREATAYVAASTITGGVIGAVFGGIGLLTRIQEWPLVASLILAFLGLLELSLIRIRFIPSLRWQVPVSWVRGRKAAPLIWGVLLGSGLSTWMPFPTYFGLLVFASMSSVPGGAVVMAMYGLGRAFPAIGVLRIGSELVDKLAARAWHLRLMTHSVAGCLTLALCGTVIGALA